MIALTLEEIADATSGALLDADPSTEVTSVEIDSRNVTRGTLFAALPGERVDGVTFVPKALEKGAVVVLVPDHHAERAQWAGTPRIEVADVQTALGRIGQLVRSRSKARVIAITGSSGKTTTKDMLKEILAGRRDAIVNAKSYNNELGVPLTLTRLEPATEIAVIEMVTVGTAMRPALTTAVAGGVAEAYEVDGPGDVVTALEPRLAAGDTVLLKASRSEGLDQSVAALLAGKPAPETGRRVLIICGGPSTEHEVSLASAQSVISEMQSRGWEVLTAAVGMDKRWYVGPDALKYLIQRADPAKLPHQVFIDDTEAADFRKFDGVPPVSVFAGYRLAFPLTHGQWGEDGTLQGLIASYGMAVAGPGVTASAVCYDKPLAKLVLRASGIPVVPSLRVSEREWVTDPEAMTKRLYDTVGAGPWFVKPGRGGSSIGTVGPVGAEELADAVDSAFGYDGEVLIEEYVPHRELMVAVIGTDELTVSPPLESIHPDEVLDYGAKYLRGQIRFAPPILSAEQSEELRDLVVATVRALGLQGYCRIDVFLDTRSGRLLVNEVNTIPGMSAGSAFSRLMELAGMTYGTMLEELCWLAGTVQSEPPGFVRPV